MRDILFSSRFCRKAVLLSGSLALLVAMSLAVGSQPAAAMPNPTPLPISSAFPVAPGIDAPISAWQHYAAEQRAATRSAAGWLEAHQSPGCSVLSVTVSPAINPPGVPSGIQLDGATIVGQCTGGLKTTPSSGTVLPAVTATCPNMALYTGQAVTNGYECAGTLTINGNSNYVGAVYTYKGTTSVTGHEELGTVGSGCSPGTAVVNGSTTTLSPNQYQEPVYLRSSSAIWTATWWQGSTSPYTNWGTVCGSY